MATRMLNYQRVLGILWLVDGLEHSEYFSIYWEFHNPN